MILSAPPTSRQTQKLLSNGDWTVMDAVVNGLKILDVQFPVFGKTISLDHAYQLYGALASLVPEFHWKNSGFRFGVINGIPVGNGELTMTNDSCLSLRITEAGLDSIFPLSGIPLRLGNSIIRTGCPVVRSLEPSGSLSARVVTFKNAADPERFMRTAQAKLAEMAIAGIPEFPLHLSGKHQGEPMRRVLRIRGITIPGYTLRITGLTDTESILLQTYGLGGRTQIGCGFFETDR